MQTGPHHNDGVTLLPTEGHVVGSRERRRQNIRRPVAQRPLRCHRVLQTDKIKDSSEEKGPRSQNDSELLNRVPKALADCSPDYSCSLGPTPQSKRFFKNPDEALPPAVALLDQARPRFYPLALSVGSHSLQNNQISRNIADKSYQP